MFEYTYGFTIQDSVSGNGLFETTFDATDVVTNLIKEKVAKEHSVPKTQVEVTSVFRIQ